MRWRAKDGCDAEPANPEEPGFPGNAGACRYLFCDTVNGANASANLYSLIETAKANSIEPYAYLKTVFTELPNAASVEEIEALLPMPADSDSLAVSFPLSDTG
ncbi:MAG TPA: transposase domain-containing protein [Woeseiaceae bacterium]|nr:transposase domain-containing protein [Woeseiaceae bacterium]